MKLPNSFAFTPKPAAAIASVRALAARVPHHAWALAALIAFAAIGAPLTDDYGIAYDEPLQRDIAQGNLRYILGDADALPLYELRYYGAAFEMPLLLAERALRLDDSRDRYMLRRLLTHLFFLCGAFACYALAYRMFNSAPLALIAMLLFLLHPRIYAHSFFNSKDSPFLAAFMIALYLIHRAFAKNSVWAFALLGICVGLMTNVRIMGAMLVPAVLGMRVCDAFCADGQGIYGGRGWRMRVLATGAAFAAAFAAAFYVSTPYLWNSPLALIDAIAQFRDHPGVLDPLFQGVRYRSGELPWHYIPVWVWITTPPITLLFAAAGATVVIWRAAVSPASAIRNGDARFGLLLIASAALPVIAMAAIDARLNGAWRQAHFIYAPLCVLAAWGLRDALRAPEIRLTRAVRSRFSRRGAARFALPPQISLALCARLAICGAAAAGLAAAAIAIIQLHPHQHIYFNFFVDRETPERLRKEYTMDYWGLASLQGAQYLLELHPSGPIFVDKGIWGHNAPIYLLPESELYRILVDANADDAESYHIVSQDELGGDELDDPRYAEMPQIYAVKIYNSAIMAVYGEAPQREDAREGKLAVNAARHREIYDAIASTQPLVRAHYDIYLNHAENALVYVKERCAFEDMTQRFFLHITPANPDDLTEDRKRHGYDNADFHMLNHFIYPRMRTGVVELGSMLGERCLASVKLPRYPIAAITTGQFANSGRLWTADLDLAAAD